MVKNYSDRRNFLLRTIFFEFLEYEKLDNIWKNTASHATDGKYSFNCIARSAEAVEFTDCISAEE